MPSILAVALAATGCASTGASAALTGLRHQVRSLRAEVSAATAELHATRAQCAAWRRRVGRDSQLALTDAAAVQFSIDLGSVGQKMIDLHCPGDPARALRRSFGLGVRPVAEGSTAASRSPVVAVPSCTRTNEDTCIQGGEFCRNSGEGTYGYDADGRRYLCTSGHWEGPE